jgi:putative tricarboxylic transport membrane protein
MIFRHLTRRGRLVAFATRPGPTRGTLGKGMQKLNIKNGDVVSGAVMAALGTYIVVQAVIWPYYDVSGPGPGFFPLWYGILMIGLSLSLVISAARRPKPETEPAGATGIGRAVVVWTGFTISLVLMAFLGFCISFTLFTMFIVSYVLGRPILTGLLTGAISAASFYVLFWVILGVQLPTGYVGF